MDKSGVGTAPLHRKETEATKVLVGLEALADRESPMNQTWNGPQARLAGPFTNTSGE